MRCWICPTWLTGVPERTAVEEQFRAMKFELRSLTMTNILRKFEERGGIAEEYITGTKIESPSAQLRNTPLGQVELLSTHDQILGGPSGQSYLGCSFPANAEYGPAIMREAEKVGKRFAREGIVGRYALDFVVVQKRRRASGSRMRLR